MRKKSRSGFSLVELLVVLSIMGVLSALVSVGFQSILGTGFSSEVSDLSSVLIRARAHAMANNTYVYVGITEVNAATSSSDTQTSGNGRLGVIVVATNDGTSGYDPTSLASSSALPTASAAGTSLILVSPLRRFDNIHLLSTSGISNLPNTSSGSTSNLQTSSSLTTLQWPLSGTAQYSFGSAPGSVIQFNPQGEACIYTGKYTDSYLQWIEIDLQPTHGSQVPGTKTNAAAILIDGASGAVTTYRS